MNLVFKIKRRLQFMLARFIRPTMIVGWKLPNGRYLKLVRVSNMTHIDYPKNLEFGDNCYVGHFNFLEASNRLVIGEGCQITNYCTITTHSSHQSIRLYGDAYTKHKDLKGYLKGDVEIGKYTFVGPHSVIMPGSKIGKGSLVSAYSYVDGEYPDFSILKGNPAKVVGSTKDMDEELLDENPDLMKLYNKWAK